MDYKEIKTLLLESKLLSIEAEGIYDEITRTKIFEKIYLSLDTGSTFSFELNAPHFKDDANLIFEKSEISSNEICYKKHFESKIINVKCFVFKGTFSEKGFFQLELDLESLTKISIGYFYYNNDSISPIVTGEIGLFYGSIIESKIDISYIIK